MQARTLLFAAAMTVAPLAPAHAQSNMDSMTTGASAAKTGTVHKASGVVKSVDRAKGSVVLAHGPVATLKWPAMTMSFLVKDQRLLDKLPVGKKVEVEFVQQNKDYVITGVN